MKIEELWSGADFVYNEQRYCVLEINGKEKEVLATKITYDESHVTGNLIVSFDYGQEIEYCPRITEKTKSFKIDRDILVGIMNKADCDCTEFSGLKICGRCQASIILNLRHNCDIEIKGAEL